MSQGSPPKKDEMDFWPCLLAADSGLVLLAPGAAKAFDAPDGLPAAVWGGPDKAAGVFRLGARPCRDWLLVRLAPPAPHRHTES